MESHISGGEQCTRPPALDDLDLIAAADGEARPEVAAHLAVCRSCASRASAIMGLQNALRRRLFRAFCPSSDDLLAFHHHHLPDARSTRIATHIDECPHCTRELQLIMRAAHEPPQLFAGVWPLRRLVAQPLATAGPVGSLPLYGAARSGSANAQYAYRAENLELTLRVARVVGRSGTLAVSGQLATDDCALEALLPGATAHLLSNADEQAVVSLDELGGFFFDGVCPGEYQLSVRLGECEVVVEAFAV